MMIERWNFILLILKFRRSLLILGANVKRAGGPMKLWRHCNIQVSWNADDYRVPLKANIELFDYFNDRFRLSLFRYLGATARLNRSRRANVILSGKPIA